MKKQKNKTIIDLTPEEETARSNEIITLKETEKNRFIQTVKEKLNNKAQEYGYFNIESACSFGSINCTYKNESQAFIQWLSDIKEWMDSFTDNYPADEDISLPTFTP